MDLSSSTRIMFDEYGNINYVENKLCPGCKTSVVDVLRTGVVGCVECYKTFASEIQNLILQKQGAVSHVGKVSAKHISKIKVKEKIAELEAQKEQAAKEENYMVAETLKNQIEKLKGEL